MGNGAEAATWTDADRDRWRNYVNDWLRARRFTQTQVAEILGLSQAAMTQWCKHGDRPSLPNAEAFGEKIGDGAAEGRRMGGYSAATEMDSTDPIEELREELRAANEKLDRILGGELGKNPLLTKMRKEAEGGTRSRVKKESPPL